MAARQLKGAAWSYMSPEEHGAADAFGAAADAVMRWLAVGRDVVIRGDTGSGRTSTLRKVVSLAGRAGFTAVVADQRTLTSFPVDRAAHRVRGTRADGDVARQLAEDLGGRGLLLVDDLDTLSDEAVDVLEHVLARTPSRLASTTTADFLRGGRSLAVARLISERGPAEVEVRPVGFRSMASVIAARLGGPVHSPLISELVAWSAGNVAVAVAIVDAARFAGVVVRRGGTWSLAGEIESVPVDAVAHLLASGLSPACLAALEALSVIGPTQPDALRRLVSEADLATLVERRRVVVHRHQGGDGQDLMAVSPPALALALRDRLNGLRRLQLMQLASDEASGEAATSPPRPPFTEVLTTEAGRLVEADARWVAELTALVHEQSVSAESAARSRWEQHPRVESALPYLAALLRRPGGERVAEVIARTPVCPTDDPGQVAMLRSLEHAWRAWTGASGGEPGSESLELPDDLRQMVATVQRANQEGWSDDDLAARLALPGEDGPQPWAAQARLSAAAALLAASRFDLVLDLTADKAPLPAWMPSEYRHNVAGIRSMALLLMGRIDEAEALARQGLDEASDSLDGPGIRVHGLTLAHALAVSGQQAMTWRIVGAALRLGPPGPLGTTFYRRTLTLGTMLAARGSTLGVAHLLAGELSETRPHYRPVVGSMQELAQAYMMRADGRDREADQLLWSRGEWCVSQGWTSPATEYWALRTTPPTASQAAAISALLERVSAPLFEPLLTVHLALAGVPDCDALEDAMRRAPLMMAPGLAATAATVLSDARARQGREPLTDAELESIIGTRVARTLRHVSPASGAAELLSERELEIAWFLVDDLSNREIADRLTLSARTVENHVHRILRKLGATRRQQVRAFLVGPGPSSDAS